MPTDFGGLVRTVLIPQLAVIAPLALLMTLHSHQQPAANAAAEMAAVAGDSRRGACWRSCCTRRPIACKPSCSSSIR